MANNNFNFIVLTTSGIDFDFGSTGTEPYYSFNFTESGYSPSSPYSFLFGEGFNIYSILKGTSNNFTSVWVYNNKMYVASADVLTTINLSDNSVYDWYTQTAKGRGNETLDSSNVVDINVTQGV